MRYAHSLFYPVTNESGRAETTTEFALQYRLYDEGTACGRITWSNGWQVGTDLGWSEPILSCGGKDLGGGGAPYTDARDSAAVVVTVNRRARKPLNPSRTPMEVAMPGVHSVRVQHVPEFALDAACSRVVY